MKKILAIIVSMVLLNTVSFCQRQVCSAIMPEKKTSLDTLQMRGLADNYYLWNNGQNIYIQFLNGSNEIQNKIKKIAKQWEKFANIYFVFIKNGNSNVRINLDSKGGYNSVVGTLSNSLSQKEPTMNYDTTDFKNDTIIKRVVLHEFGHAIGLLHEHFNPLSGILWNKDSVYNDLFKTVKWERKTVDDNIFQEYKLSYTNGTLYDKFSIMEYPIKSTWTKNGYSVDWNNELSSGDITLVKSLYPFQGKRINEVPRFQVTSVRNIEFLNSKIKDGLLIYPKFTISTSGKEGTVYFIVSFFNSDGEPISNKSDKYSIGNNLATFRSFVLPPNKRIQANNGKHDFELYIPYSVFPLPKGKSDIKAKFTALLYHNNEVKSLGSSESFNCIIIK